MTPHIFKAAIRNLHSTTLRTALAMLGIIVGTAAVVAMVSTGEMATEQALAQFKILGTDLLSLSLNDKEGSDKTGQAGSKKSLNWQDISLMDDASRDIDLVAPYIAVYPNISYKGNIVNGNVIGATAELQDVIRIKMIAGRFISPFDTYEKYCVLGSQIYQSLKQYTNNPLNSHIQLGTRIFEVVGVVDVWPENAFFEQDINFSVIVPIRTAVWLSTYADISHFVIRLKPNANITSVKTALTQYLQKTLPDKQINFRSAKELVKSMAVQHKIFTLLLSLIGSISLLVGGIGVMNIMLVSVLERRREIGIRLAIGAHRKEIQSMFLTEAVLLSVIGGMIGTITGILFSLIVSFFAHWHFHFFLLPPLIGFSVSVLIGIFFGYYPAHRAAQLDPIETLRAE
jgi:putative ABC transport system permease protein